MNKNKKTVRMPKKLFEDFIYHLRSGKVKQGTGMLFRSENDVDEENGERSGYCCLGVLQCTATGGFIEVCSLFFKNHFRSYPTMQWLEKNGITFINSSGDNTNNPYFPSVFATAGCLNDDLKYDFKQIADIFERHTETY